MNPSKDMPKEYEICLSCGYCTNVCPVVQVRGFETYSPRGKLYAIKKASKFSFFDCLLGRKIEVKELSKPVFECTLCGRCEVACHTRLKLVDFFEDYRGKIAKKISYDDRQEKMIESIKKNGNSLNQPREKRDNFYKFEYEKNKRNADVLYFAGCLTSYVYFDLQRRIIKILKSSGLEVSSLGNEEECCGRVLRMLGRFEDFAEIAKRNAERIKATGAKIVVTGCPGCYKALKYHYPEVLGKDVFNGMRVLHTTEIFLELAKEGKISIRRKMQKSESMEYIWHDPCELSRGCGVIDAPRELLATLGIKFKEYESKGYDSECCGGGGALRAIEEELCKSISLKKFEHAKELGSNAIITSCPNCLSTFEFARPEGKYFVYDISELIDIK